MIYDILQSRNFELYLKPMEQVDPENSHFGCFHSLKAHTNSSQYLSLIVAIGLRTKALADLI